jgi:hypothetical protein
VVFLDQRDFSAQLRGSQGGDISARTGADDGNIKMITHSVF